MATTPLNGLNAFVAVARLRSFSAAARSLGVTASALSQSVKELEKRLGVSLLTRTSRSMALTPAGQRLLEQAGPAIDLALESLRSVRRSPAEVKGLIRLSVPDDAVAVVLKGLLQRFVRLHPEVEVEVFTENHLVDIVAGCLDAGIRLHEAIERDMVQVRLTPAMRFVVVGSPAYLERRGVPLRPEDLLRHDCIGIQTSPGGTRYAWEFERGRRTWRVPVRGPITASDTSLMRALAADGAGLAYGLEPLVAEDVTRGRLRVVLDAYAPRVPGFFLYFPSRAHVSPAFRAFVDAARELASEAKGGVRNTSWPDEEP